MATRRATAPTPQDPAGPFGPPVAPPRARRLRAVVLAHRLGEPRRRVPALLHAGRPGSLETARPAQERGDDHALRVEVLEAMLRRVRALPADRPDRDDRRDDGRDDGDGPLVWLTRSGPLTLQDVDAAWGAALRTACAELGADPLPFVVVTRSGWWEPATGSGRGWRRLRAHS